MAGGLISPLRQLDSWTVREAASGSFCLILQECVNSMARRNEMDAKVRPQEGDVLENQGTAGRKRRALIALQPSRPGIPGTADGSRRCVCAVQPA